jgi:putative MFS transporter
MGRIGGGLAPILAGKIMETSTAGAAVLIMAVISSMGALDVLVLGKETKGEELV